MAIISLCLSKTTLHINEINSVIRRQKNVDKIHDPAICCWQETNFDFKNKHRLKVKGWNKKFHANWNKKKAGIGILPSNKIDFKPKKIARDKESNYIMIKDQLIKKIQQ